MDTKTEYLSGLEAGKILGLSRYYITQLRNKGKLQGYQMPSGMIRYKKTDVMELQINRINH